MIRQLSNNKFLIPTMLIIVMLAAGSGFYISLKQSQQAMQSNPGIDGLYWPNPKQIGHFAVFDQNGKPFGLHEMQGKWSFIFFGYTHCPDICPITMRIMADTYKGLKAIDDKVQIVFVSVDPERDTQEKLSQYVSYFNNEFIGLGGDLNRVDSLTKQIGVPYYQHKKTGVENYLVDHSASIFLIDPKVRLVSRLSPPHQKTQIIERFTKISKFINAQR